MSSRDKATYYRVHVWKYTQDLRSLGHSKRGYKDPDEENSLRDNNKKNAKALVFFQ